MCRIETFSLHEKQKLVFQLVNEKTSELKTNDQRMIGLYVKEKHCIATVLVNNFLTVAETSISDHLGVSVSCS